MMKRLLPLFMLLMLPAAAMAQWEYAGVFPVADTFTVDMHGVAVDPDGKVWLTPFGSTEALLDQTSGDTLRNEDGSAIVTRAIYVYNADGTEVDFSPIQYLTPAPHLRRRPQLRRERYRHHPGLLAELRGHSRRQRDLLGRLHQPGPVEVHTAGRV
jgi:hypothetical protein